MAYEGFDEELDEIEVGSGLRKLTRHGEAPRGWQQ